MGIQGQEAHDHGLRQFKQPVRTLHGDISRGDNADDPQGYRQVLHSAKRKSKKKEVSSQSGSFPDHRSIHCEYVLRFHGMIPAG